MVFHPESDATWVVKMLMSAALWRKGEDWIVGVQSEGKVSITNELNAFGLMSGKGVTNVYHDVFSYLEQTNLLEAGNAMHLWALHFVFLPRINADLNLFKAQWNHHGLRSEGHMSPHQLFVSRALELFGSERTGIKDLFDPSVEPEVTDLYGVENEDMDLEGPEEQAGEAQLVQCPLSDEALEELRRHVNPENDQDELGIQSYQQVLEFIQTHLHV